MTILPFEHHQDRFARGLATALGESSRWLDVGAGITIHNGGPTHHPNDLAAKAALLVGCDVVVDHLRDNPYLTAAVGSSVYSLPFASGSFDVVSANMVLEHLERPEVAFSEVSRVLSPGGWFIAVTPNVRNPIIGLSYMLLSARTRSALAARVEKREEDHIFPTFYRSNTPSVLRALGRAVGLRDVTVDVFNSMPFTNALPLPFRVAESALRGVLSVGPMRRFASNIFVAFRKDDAPALANSL